MNNLETILLNTISNHGPMNIAAYMSECLLHPKFGYYATRDPFGQKGDFITAPEISQIFGELIGLCLAQSWIDQGAPDAFTLAELGPGRGTLMADILRTTRAVPGFHAAANIHLVEASNTLQQIQKQSLHDFDVTWIDHVDALPHVPLFVVANEFFDALPIRQFIRAGDGWRERCVAQTDGNLFFGATNSAPQPALEHRLVDTNDGDVVEVNAAATAISATLGARIQTHGGAGLIIDYGDWHSLGDTFQALKNHAPVSPLETPGMADLTAHVDFETLALSTPSAYTRLTPQGVFLERLGATERAQSLAKNLSGKALDAHIAAHKRLTHPQEMGALFKVFGLYPKGATPPPGLNP